MPNIPFETPLLTLDNLPFPAFLLVREDDGRYVLAQFNQLSEKEFFSDVDGPAGREITHIFPGAQGVQFQQKLEESFTTDQPMSFECSVHRTHYSLQFQIYLQPLLHESVKSLLISAIDITKAKAALSESTKMALLINEMESYMANAAHDLQHPIEHLSSLSQELKSNFKDLGDGKLQLLDQVEELSNATLTMIRQVIDQSHAINPLTRSVPRYDLKPLCADALTVFDPLQKHELKMGTVWVEGDSRAMRIAIATLIENAVRHNTELALTISIAVCMNIENQVEITVHDNGKGFANTAIATHSQTKSSNNPTLNMVELYKFIAEHGGAIRLAKQNPASGAAFTFSLPGILIE